MCMLWNTNDTAQEHRLGKNTSHDTEQKKVRVTSCTVLNSVEVEVAQQLAGFGLYAASLIAAFLILNLLGALHY